MLAVNVSSLSKRFRGVNLANVSLWQSLMYKNWCLKTVEMTSTDHYEVQRILVKGCGFVLDFSCLRYEDDFFCSNRSRKFERKIRLSFNPIIVNIDRRRYTNNCIALFGQVHMVDVISTLRYNQHLNWYDLGRIKLFHCWDTSPYRYLQ